MKFCHRRLKQKYSFSSSELQWKGNNFSHWITCRLRHASGKIVTNPGFFLNLLKICWQIISFGACKLISHWYLLLSLLWHCAHLPSWRGCLLMHVILVHTVCQCNIVASLAVSPVCPIEEIHKRWIDQEKHVTCSGRSNAFVRPVHRVFLLRILFQQHFVGRQGPAFKRDLRHSASRSVDEWASCSGNKNILKAQKWTRYLIQLYK